jgi:hypothetical protein
MPCCLLLCAYCDAESAAYWADLLGHTGFVLRLVNCFVSLLLRDIEQLLLMIEVLNNVQSMWLLHCCVLCKRRPLWLDLVDKAGSAAQHRTLHRLHQHPDMLCLACALCLPYLSPLCFCNCTMLGTPRTLHGVFFLIVALLAPSKAASGAIAHHLSQQLRALSAPRAILALASPLCFDTLHALPCPSLHYSGCQWCNRTSPVNAAAHTISRRLSTRTPFQNLSDNTQGIPLVLLSPLRFHCV